MLGVHVLVPRYWVPATDERFSEATEWHRLPLVGGIGKWRGGARCQGAADNCGQGFQLVANGCETEMLDALSFPELCEATLRASAVGPGRA